MAIRGARGDLTQYEVIPVKGENIQGSIPGILHFRTHAPEGGKLCVCYARDVWRRNGLRIRTRLVVLSNFHVQSIFIRVTVYFLLIFKD